MGRASFDFFIIISLYQIEIQQIAEGIRGEIGHAAVVDAGAVDFIGAAVRIHAGDGSIGLGNENVLSGLIASRGVGNRDSDLLIPAHVQAKSLAYGTDRKHQNAVFGSFGSRRRKCNHGTHRGIP